MKPHLAGVLARREGAQSRRASTPAKWHTKLVGDPTLGPLMERDLVCKWLGLPPESWPPDHYTLLGLKTGEEDVGKIEEHAHERLARLRQHQLNHPDQVTEAMNRLAQAFSCLTDPKAKKAYDAAMRTPGGPAP